MLIITKRPLATQSAKSVDVGNELHRPLPKNTELQLGFMSLWHRQRMSSITCSYMLYFKVVDVSVMWGSIFWWLQCGAVITQSIFFHKYSQKTPHSAPVRGTYGVHFVDPASDWYFASVPVIVYVISYNIGPLYNGILLWFAWSEIIHERWTWVW